MFDARGGHRDLDGPVALAAAIACITTAAGHRVPARRSSRCSPRSSASATSRRRTRPRAWSRTSRSSLGPAIGAGLLVHRHARRSRSPSTALTFLVSAAICAAGLRVHSRGSAERRSEAERVGPEPDSCTASASSARSADARVLGGYMLGTAFIYGIQTVVLVLVAGEQLEAGADGVGLFYAALGLGGVIGAALVSRLARSRAARRGPLRVAAPHDGPDGAARGRRARAAVAFALVAAVEHRRGRARRARAHAAAACGPGRGARPGLGRARRARRRRDHHRLDRSSRRSSTLLGADSAFVVLALVRPGARAARRRRAAAGRPRVGRAARSHRARGRRCSSRCRCSRSPTAR